MIEVHHDDVTQGLLSDFPCSAIPRRDLELMVEERVQAAFNDQNLVSDIATTEAKLVEAENEVEYLTNRVDTLETLLHAAMTWTGDHKVMAADITPWLDRERDDNALHTAIQIAQRELGLIALPALKSKRKKAK